MWTQPIDSNDTEIMMRLSSIHPLLTRAEVRILAFIERGFKNRDIASLLGCSVRNIDNHRYRMGKKLKINDRQLGTTYHNQ